MTKHHRIFFFLLSLCILCGSSIRIQAQESTPKNEPTLVNQKLLKELLQRLAKVEGELKRIKENQGDIPGPQQKGKLFALLETPYLGHLNYSSTGRKRYFAAHLVFINLGNEPITIKREQFELLVDGTPHKLTELNNKIRYTSFRVGNQSYQLNNLKTPKQLKIPRGGTASTWMVFQELPAGNDVPRMVLRYPSSGKTGKLDINAYSKELLDITVDQIGPQNCLSLITIAGTLNPINSRALVEELDKLVARKVARAVVRFSETATPLSAQLYSWLNQSVSNNGSSSQQQFPTIPAAIRELHFSRIPLVNSTSPYAGSGSSQLRIHSSDSQAVSSALRTAYEVLGRDELVKSIETGHELSRAAALANGAGRLSSERLSLILKYTDDKNPLFQQGALVALKHFGEQAAVDKLLFYVKKGKAPLSQTAVESLAGSRYPAAHDALLKVLQNEDPKSRKSIVQVLARYPRPVWGKTLYKFAQGSNTELSTEALRALAQIGHPKLVEVLEEKLNTGNSTLRAEALRMLISRDDPKSEQLAMNYTLKFIEKNPPTSEMFGLLNRTKDQRAIPLLLKHFEATGNDRSTLINTLAQIGDSSLEAPFVEKYPQLSNQEKRTILTALQQLRSNHCRKLAGQALLSQDSSLASTASEVLRKDGGPEAVQLLITAFEKTTHSSSLSYISNALGQIGGNEIRPIMSKAKHSANSTKRTYAQSTLSRLLTRSPGYQYYAQAQNFAKQKKWTETISNYSLAIEADPELPEAYSGRGNAYLQEKKHKEAKPDFQKAAKLDPYSTMAITGLALIEVLEGKPEDAIQTVEKSRDTFKNDALYLYNTACVYSQAVASLLKADASAERDEKQQQYQETAIADLKKAVQLGFRDLNWMKEDPDLEAIRKLPDFQQIIAPTKPTGSTTPQDTSTNSPF